jgi:hypothetical protein
MKPNLPPAALKKIYGAVDLLFDRIKIRLFGRSVGNKQIIFNVGSYIPELTLPGLYVNSCVEGGALPDVRILENVMEVAEGYVDVQRQSARTQVANAVHSFLLDAHNKKIATDVDTVLGGELGIIWKKVENNLTKIVATETHKAQSMGTLESISAVNAASGIEDPVVYFVGPMDNETCEECIRLFFMPDRVTPRVWKLSEVGSGYHKKGDSSPKISGLHPFCRHKIATLMPGYGFKNGKIAYIGRDYNEFENQR